jgi:hypothetical protein
MKRLNSLCAGRYFCVVAAVFGVFSYFTPPDPPEKVIKDFVTTFQSKNSAAIYAMMHPDVVSGKEISQSDVDSFLKHYKVETLKFENFNIARRMKSEDGSTERFQATLTFRGPVLAPEYPKPSAFEMDLLWVLEDKKWWVERTFATDYIVSSDKPYPTKAQDENAVQFQAALAVLDKIKSSDNEAVALAGPTTQGTGSKEYTELESVYRKERGPKGLDSDANGIQLFLKGASRSTGGLLSVYYGDFRNGPKDTRKPVPWGMFKDYALAATASAKNLEKRGKGKAAEAVYKRLINLGGQLLSEPGGVQFAVWGSTFQKQGAEGLAQVAAAGERERAAAFARVASRRLDVLQTAMACLDDMADYKSLKSAIIAAGRTDDAIFGPWGINTLSIFALKGAPANDAAIKAAGGTVLVRNPAMQKKALEVLNQLGTEPSGKVKAFIANQKEWITSHNVYGVIHPFNK